MTKEQTTVCKANDDGTAERETHTSLFEEFPRFVAKDMD